MNTMVEEKSAAQDHILEQPTVRVAVATSPVQATVKQRRSPGTSRQNTPLLNRVRWGGISILALIQTGLLLTAYLPTRIITDLGWTTSNGPFPAAAAPVVTMLFYLLPFGSGLLAHRWDLALLASTAPAWLAIGLFTVTSSTQNGIFYFTKLGQPANLVGTLELFAALGFFGWITRRVFSRQPE